MAGACSKPSPSPAPSQPPPPPAAPIPDASGTILFHKPSPFGEVFVVQEGALRCLTLDTPKDIQSCIEPGAPDKVIHEYVRFLTVGLLFAKPAPRTLMIGLGGGSSVGILRSAAPGIRFDIVEINGTVVEAARQWFNIVESDTLRVHVGDGRAFVEQARETWDLVVLDAFSSEGIPPHLGTAEFLRAVKARTAPDGVVVANLWDTDPVLYKNMLRTYQETFPAAYVFEGKESGNVIVVALQKELDGGCPAVVARASEPQWRSRLSFDLGKVAGACMPMSGMRLAGAQVLRDGVDAGGN